MERIRTQELAEPFDRDDVIQAFVSLTDQLLNRFIDYDFVLVEDTSGRIPGLVIGKVAANTREELGLERPQVKFVGGSKLSDTITLPTNFIPPQTVPSARALIVTEGVFTGKQASKLANLFAGNRASEFVDIAALGSYSEFADIPAGVSLYKGAREKEGGRAVADAFYYNRAIKGVTKHSVNRTPFATPDRSGSSAKRRVRHDASVVAAQLTELVLDGLMAPPPYPEVTPEVSKVLV